MFQSILRQSAEIRQLKNTLNLSTHVKNRPPDRMQAWQIHAYGGVEQLELENIRTPIITKPEDVLVQIRAASVNPIDVAVMKGYGSKVLNLLRKSKSVSSDIEFPLILGRDFSGVVVSKGCNVEDRLRVGDEVWGVLPVEQQGCHANYVTLSQNLVNPKPANLSHIEAASILYAGLTAWSSLWITGGISCESKSLLRSQSKKILILGGSGGVGTLAIQLAKAWNLHVVTTCSSDAVTALENLGADVVIDYKQSESHSKVISEGIYDIILDCSNQGPDLVRSFGYEFNTYVTLNSPLLKNIDEYGFFGGAMKNIIDLFTFNVPTKKNERGCVKWGFFMPSNTGINTLQDLVEKKALRPVVQEVYPFNELPKAYEKVLAGHLRGKVVIDMKV